jgi:hypothetical protein
MSMEQKRKNIIEERAMGYRDAMTKRSPGVLEQVVEFIRQVSYGEILITIHDSKVVQIEKREKTRFRD